METVYAKEIQLIKIGNKAWGAKDVAKMRGQVVGKYITEPLIFNPEVDAVSKATITSSIIYNSISQGESLLKVLKEKGRPSRSAAHTKGLACISAHSKMPQSQIEAFKVI